MKQLVGISNNLFFDKDKNPMVETVFMIHEPKWEMIDGQPIKKQRMKEVRTFNKFETLEKIFTRFIKETKQEISELENQSS